MEYKILKTIRLGPQHAATGNARHFGDGCLLPPPHELRIVQIHGDEGVLLLHLDKNGEEFTDTWHQSIDDAMLQGEFEFGIRADEWTTLAAW